MNGQEQNPKMEEKCPQCGASLPPGALGGLCPACLLKQGATAETATQGEALPFDPPKIEELAKLFPNLEILELIGKGGMGAVYKARQTALDRLVALKILPPQIGAGPGFAERFNREARALAKLNHPNIVGIYEFGQVRDLPYFIMEYVDGLNLRQVQRAGKLSPREALQIVPQICEALQFAHDEGIVHRDIKPENILVDKKGRVKIADFGIAKIMGREPHFNLTETRVAIGTPQYMAPEQIEKPQSVDHRADIFSLGVVFYEMLTGELPLGKFAPPSSTSKTVHVDVRLDDVVLRALEKEPERRYQQASQVKTAVETISSTPPPRSEAESQALINSLSASDYSLSIQSCLQRSWHLLTSDFWRIVGVNAVIMLLLWAGGAVTFSLGEHRGGGGSLLDVILYGPLYGGLYLYFLKRIRGESATIETAFAGFSSRFVQLLLGAVVSLLLAALGLVCLILPGIYLLVCWQFTLPLIMDKGMEFWPAMKLSRAMVRKHWWKVFGLVLVVVALHVVGILLFGFGLLITAPLAVGTLLYAYQDIFVTAVARGPAPVPPVAEPQTGPSGTAIVPVAPRRRIFPRLLAGGIALAIIILLMARFIGARDEHRRRQMAYATAPESIASAYDTSASEAEATTPTFGAVVEKTVTEGINFKSGKLMSLPESIQSGEGDLSETILSALRKAELIGIDAFRTDRGTGLYAVGGTTFAEVPSTNWDTMAPDEILPAITNADAGDKPKVVMQMGTDETATYAFQTRDSTQGLLQILGTNGEPAGLKIRYKLAQDTRASPGGASENEPNRLSQRLEAAKLISQITQKDSVLSAIAADAAKAGELQVTREAINEMNNLYQRDATAAVAAKSLARRGFRAEALQMASEIGNINTRDQTLAELAR